MKIKVDKKHFTVNKNFLRTTLSFCIFLFLGIYITYPLIFHIGEYSNSEIVITWIQNWVVHSIFTNPLGLFDTNVYYPFHNTLAYSDTFLSSSILVLPIYFLIREPLVLSNTTFITSLILLGFSIYILSYYITKNFWISILSGILINFSPYVLDKRIHIQILAVEGVPFAIFFFLKFLDSSKYKYLVLSLIFFLLQTYNSFMPGYFILFSYIIIYFFYFHFKNNLAKKMISKKNILTIVISFLLPIPIIIPYLQVSKEFAYVRDIRETIHFALQPEDLYVPNEYTRLQMPLSILQNLAKYPANAEIKSGYIGFVFSLLSLLSFFYIFKINKKKNFLFIAFISVALLGFILSFGPFLHFERKTIHHPFPIPLPYLLFYYLAPGFQGFRNSARFEILFIVSEATVISIMLNKLLNKKAIKIKYFIIILLIIGVIAEYQFPMNFRSLPTKEHFPQVYSWISKNTSSNPVIIELPIYNWDINPFGDNREVLREYYSTIHFRKMVNGGSGFSPPPWQTLVISLYKSFPSKTSLNTIKKLGVKYMIVHLDEFNIIHKTNFISHDYLLPDGENVMSELSVNPSINLVKRLGNDYVYEFK